MPRGKLKTPRSLRPRLRAVADQHGFESIDAVAFHFVDSGLRRCGVEGSDLATRLERATEEQGYSSPAELVEHFLIRGLRAYEKAEDDPARLKERLRGLGYIE
jgi:hypothetical protein